MQHSATMQHDSTTDGEANHTYTAKTGAVQISQLTFNRLFICCLSHMRFFPPYLSQSPRVAGAKVCPWTAACVSSSDC